MNKKLMAIFIIISLLLRSLGALYGQDAADPESHEEHSTGHHHETNSEVGRDEAVVPQPIETDSHAEKHDHFEHHHDDTGSPIENLLSTLGKFHVLVIHFPIALLFSASFFELISILKKSHPLHKLAGSNLLLGALSAVLAAALGWMNAQGAAYTGEEANLLEFHMWFGASTSVLALAAGFLFLKSHYETGHLITYYRLLLFIVTIAVAVTGHFGGSLVFGADYF